MKSQPKLSVKTGALSIRPKILEILGGVANGTYIFWNFIPKFLFNLIIGYRIPVLRIVLILITLSKESLRFCISAQNLEPDDLGQVSPTNQEILFHFSDPSRNGQ